MIGYGVAEYGDRKKQRFNPTVEQRLLIAECCFLLAANLPKEGNKLNFALTISIFRTTTRLANGNKRDGIAASDGRLMVYP